MSPHDDEIAENKRRMEYIDAIRNIAKPHRLIGFVACLVGAIIVVWSSYKAEGRIFSVPGYTGLAIIAFGWALFAYAVWARTRYVRTHPFEPKD